MNTVDELLNMRGLEAAHGTRHSATLNSCSLFSLFQYVDRNAIAMHEPESITIMCCGLWRTSANILSTMIDDIAIE